MSDAALLMDRMYRRQRHIYDATRKFYLLGRDSAIAALAPRPGETVLEIGCGTGRNLIAVARRFPNVAVYGLDISSKMLATARAAIRRAGLDGRVTLAQGDAADFDPQKLFGRAAFDRVLVSYALSMIPPWREALAQAIDVVAEGGTLQIVDFGDQAGLPLVARRPAPLARRLRGHAARRAQRRARRPRRGARPELPRLRAIPRLRGARRGGEAGRLSAVLRGGGGGTAAFRGRALIA